MYFFIRIVWRQKLKHGNKEATTFTVNVGCVQQFLVAKNRQIATKQLLKNANIIRKIQLQKKIGKQNKMRGFGFLGFSVFGFP